MSRFQKAAGRELQLLQFRYACLADSGEIEAVCEAALAAAADGLPIDCWSLMLALAHRDGISMAQAQDRVVGAYWREVH